MASSSTFTAISTGFNRARRLEREAGRNLEVMWLTGRLAPDHKTIADFRKDNGPAIRKVCAAIRRVVPQDGSADEGQRAIDGSKFKARATLSSICFWSRILRLFQSAPI